jgi:hypothetical protein
VDGWREREGRRGMNRSRAHTPARVYDDCEQRTIQSDVDEITPVEKSRDDVEL